jgi:hypothetical protein
MLGLPLDARTHPVRIGARLSARYSPCPSHRVQPTSSIVILLAISPA